MLPLIARDVLTGGPTLYGILLGAVGAGAVAGAARFVETWFEASWIEHLRHHERVTGAGRAVQEQVRALHQGTDAPRVQHFLSSAHKGATP